MSMWLSSTQPHIALWGGGGGGGGGGDGFSLRSGRPSGVGVAAAAENGEAGSGAAAPEADMDDVFEMAAAYGDGAREGSPGNGNGGCLLDAPVGVIRGQPGVMRHVILNNR